MNEICLLIENHAEQELIREILGNSYSITIADSPVDQDCDLFITSVSMFDRHKEILKKIKKTADPIFVPVLLITLKSEINLMVSDLHEIIDEVIAAPLTASKLIPRTGILLRMRTQSMQLHRWHTECVKREEDLRISKKQLAEEKDFSDTILNTEGALVAVLNNQAEVVRFNRACEITTGYSFEEIKGHKIWDLFSEEELADVREHYNGIMCGHPAEFENFIISKSGHRREINWRNSLICNDQVEYIIATGIDITDHKNTERKLQESETRLQIAQKASKIGTFDYNIQSDINIWTPELEAIHGLSPGQFGKDQLSWENLVHPEDRALAWEKVNLAYETGDAVSGEWRVIWPDGSVHWIQAGFQVFYDGRGKPLRLIGINIDITERKENELQLLRKNKVVQYVKEVLAGAVFTETDEQLGDRCLQLAISMTGSEYGFIGEIGTDGYLHDIAISGMGWEVCAMYDKSGHRRHPGNFVIHGLYGRVLDFSKSFFTNKPSVHPDHLGLPQGHPPLKNFIGVPFIYQGKTTGMIALANKAGGYSNEDAEDLEALAPSIVESLLRKRAEKALRESNRNLEEAQKISHVGSWIWNVETSELFCTAETFRIYGEEPFSFQPTTDIFLAHVHPEDREYINDVLIDLKAGQIQRIDQEFRILRKDSSVRYIHSTGEVIEYTADGKPHLIRGTGQDITVRKQAEEALLDSEARLKKAISIETMGVLFFRLDGHITGANATFERLSGYSSDELGKITHWKNLTAPEFWDVTIKTAENLATSGDTTPYEKQMISKSGLRWWGLFAPTRLSGNGTISECVEFIIDITDRKRAEEGLKFERERLQIILNNMDTGVILLDNKGIQLTFNKAVLEWFGYTAESEMWKHSSDYINEFELRDSEDTAIPFEMWPAPRAVNGEYVKNLELKLIRKQNNKSRWISFTTVPIHGSHKEVISILMSMADITERKQADEALLRYTNELAAANRDLESFSYSVSHDLRNPLGLIGGFASFLIEDYSDKLDEEVLDYLRKINDSVKKMKILINDILSLSRIGRQEMSQTDVDFSTIVCDYLAELKQTEPDRQVEVFIEDNVHANADPNLIHLALENLLRNAWKFTAKKEITRIQFGTVVIDKKTVYFVRDNGVGFDMRFAQKIFEPFKRVHAEKEFGGTGVGLSIVQRVIGRHGGRVWAEGELGRGATFYFTLGFTLKS